MGGGLKSEAEQTKEQESSICESNNGQTAGSPKAMLYQTFGDTESWEDINKWL
jgi:hypothetical protein